MRYMTPDTPGTRSLESSVVRRTAKGAEEKLMTATAVPSKMETTTPSATPTPTPSPTKAFEATAARKPARRAIRTYGKKRPLLEDASKGNAAPQPSVVSQPAKRQKMAAVWSASSTISTPQAVPESRDLDLDEVSRQLQKEAEEAERRNKRPQTPRKPSPQKPSPPPRTAGGSPRKGIMRYFQPAAPRSAAAAPPPPPQTLPGPPCSPAASISSMSSLSSCPSPTSSIVSFLSRATSVASSPSATSAFSADEIAADEPNVASSPPVSPLWKASEPRPRQKRRLTIRPDGQLATTAVENLPTQSPNDEDAPGTKDAPTTTRNVMSMMAASSSRMRLQLGLSKTASALAPAGKKRKKTAGPPTVQTTLSLAIADGDSASVRECKECNILYNPLHEKDAKFHARYHASVCRKK